MLFRQATLLLSVAAALSSAHAASRKLSKKNQPDDDCITDAEAKKTVRGFMDTVDAISKRYYAAGGKFDCSITD